MHSARRGVGALHRRLAGVDPERPRRIHPNDPQRIQRALEVYEITGRPMSDLLREASPAGVAVPFSEARARTEETGHLCTSVSSALSADARAGLRGEVRTLWARGDLSPEMPSMRSVGYRQMLKYLFGEYTYDEMVTAESSQPVSLRSGSSPGCGRNPMPVGCWIEIVRSARLALIAGKAHDRLSNNRALCYAISSLSGYLYRAKSVPKSRLLQKGDKSCQRGKVCKIPFLNALRKERIPVSIFLVNGIKLQGQIESFDQFVVLLEEQSSAR